VRDLRDIRSTVFNHVRAALAAHSALREALVAGRIELFCRVVTASLVGPEQAYQPVHANVTRIALASTAVSA
jgi:hypothetical protein